MKTNYANKVVKGIRMIAVLLIVLIQTAGEISAQNFAYIGNGTTSNNAYTYPAPYGHYYWYSRHQFFLTAAEISASGVAAGSQISSVAFNVASINSMAYMGYWTLTVYTTTAANPLQNGMLLTGQVGASTPLNPFQPVTGWNNHPITPFTWNGTDNLVIETCHHSTAYTDNASTYWETSLSGPEIKSRWLYQDNIYTCQNSGFTGNSASIRPNIRLNWAPACSSTPGPNAVVSPTFMICPNSTVAVGLSSTYTVGNLTYQWYSSTVSPVGPFSTVTVGGNEATHIATVTANTWFQVVVGCPGASTILASTGIVSVSPTTTNTVRYYEDFEGIGLQDRLPNCSWAASGLFSTTRTYTAANTGNRIPRSGSSFAAFSNTTGTHYYYTNGIWMDAGVTYSASMWYLTNLAGSTNFSNLGIMLGTSQSSTGLTPIATVNGAVTSPVYKSLSNTFTVASSGMYYVAVKVTAAAGGAPYLTWDDLEVMIPCTNVHNPVNLTISANTTSLCQGSPVVLTGNGADFYMWNTGANTQAINETPQVTTSYTLTGINALTGCSATVVQSIKVEPAPTIGAIAFPAVSCAGQPVSLQASGAAAYVWNTSASGAVIVVTPNATTTYSVIGTGTNNCPGYASVPVTVNNNPIVNVSSSNPLVCYGDPVTLTATGAISYQWIYSGNSNVLQGSPLTVNPLVSGTYSVTGTDANGCKGTAFTSITVELCSGLSEAGGTGALKVYPNPATTMVRIENSGIVIDKVIVTDVAGRVVLLHQMDSSSADLDISSLTPGIYQLQVISGKDSQLVKVIRN